MAHKLPRVESSSASARVFPPSCLSLPCPCSNRQHSSGGLYKSPGRRALTLTLTSQTGEESPVVGRTESPLHSCCARPGPLELRSGFTVKRGSGSWGVETPSQYSSYDLRYIWKGGGGSVCLRGEHTLPDFFLTDAVPSGSGRISSSLAERPLVCISSGEAANPGATENHVKSRSQCCW